MPGYERFDNADENSVDEDIIEEVDTVTEPRLNFSEKQQVLVIRDTMLKTKIQP